MDTGNQYKCVLVTRAKQSFVQVTIFFKMNGGKLSCEQKRTGETMEHGIRNCKKERSVGIELFHRRKEGRYCGAIFECQVPFT